MFVAENICVQACTASYSCNVHMFYRDYSYTLRERKRDRERGDGCRSVLCADGGREALGVHSAGRTGVPLSSQSWKSELDHGVCN